MRALIALENVLTAHGLSDIVEALAARGVQVEIACADTGLNRLLPHAVGSGVSVEPRAEFCSPERLNAVDLLIAGFDDAFFSELAERADAATTERPAIISIFEDFEGDEAARARLARKGADAYWFSEPGAAEAFAAGGGTTSAYFVGFAPAEGAKRLAAMQAGEAAPSKITDLICGDTIALSAGPRATLAAMIARRNSETMFAAFSTPDAAERASPPRNLTLSSTLDLQAIAAAKSAICWSPECASVVAGLGGRPIVLPALSQRPAIAFRRLEGSGLLDQTALTGATETPALHPDWLAREFPPVDTDAATLAASATALAEAGIRAPAPQRADRDLRLNAVQRTVFLYADADSQVFGALPFAEAFSRAGWKVVFILDDVDDMPVAVLERVERDFEIECCQFHDLMSIHGIEGADAIGIFSRGSRIYGARKGVEEFFKGREGKRPALFTGYNGLVYERFEEGMMWRAGYDVVCLNGPRDRTLFDQFMLSLPDIGQETVLTGLHRVPQGAASQPAASEKDKRVFVFAEQVKVPERRSGREELVKELARLALANPDWVVKLKARVKPHEKTFHKIQFHIEEIKAAVAPNIANFEITYEPMINLLNEADLFATVSSTAIFEALALSVPSIAMANFGVRNAMGTHVLMNSGMFVDTRTVSKLDELTEMAPTTEWLDWIGLSGSSRIDNLVAFLSDRTYEAGTFTSQLPFAGDTGIPALNLGDQNARPERIGTQDQLDFNRARQLVLRDQVSDARNILYQLVTDNPSDTRARALLAYCYARLNDYPRAARQLESLAASSNTKKSALKAPISVVTARRAEAATSAQPQPASLKKRIARARKALLAILSTDTASPSSDGKA